MKWIIPLLILIFLSSGCYPHRDAPGFTPSPQKTYTISPPIVSPSISPTATWTESPTPSEISPAATVTLSGIPPTHQPGLIIEGQVQLEDGSGLAGVKIYRGFASYPGVEIAATDKLGSYQSGFQFIPGDEMVRVWAELPGYTFKIEQSIPGLEPGIYYWRHYYGVEQRELNFIAIPDLK